jgi:molecular chaperone HtpG
MAQNAHDSCVRRRHEDAALLSSYKPEIHIYAEHAARQLVLEDNGSGLTRDESTSFLATVGRGYTGELREQLTTAGREQALELIGLLGLGLLSAFMIASRIDITISSYQTPDTAWRWVSEGGQSYVLRRAGRDAIGTTVRLNSRDDARFLLEPDALTDVLRVYAEFLPIPIYVAHEDTPINGVPPPWTDERVQEVGRAARYSAWIEERLGVRPLTVLPLADVTTPTGNVIPLRGVLFVPPRSIISL